MIVQAIRCTHHPSAVLGLLLVLGTLTGCSNVVGPERIDLRLTIASKVPFTLQEMKRASGRLTPIAINPDGSHCRGGGGFSGFTAETPIEVNDERGITLGAGRLGQGTLKQTGSDLEGQPVFDTCFFHASIPLKSSARIYVLRIGGEGFVRRFHVSQMRKLQGHVTLKVD